MPHPEERRDSIKKQVKVSHEFDQEYWESIEDFADLVVESLKESYHSDLEPFESYAQKVKLQIAKDVDVFRQRFVRGYEVLLEELRQHQRNR